MTATSPECPQHVFIFEPRVEGHHLGYLKVITEELLAAGYRLTLAVDKSPEAFEKIRATIADSLGRVTIVSAKDGSTRRAALIKRIAAMADDARADLVFLPNLDEIGSAMLRRAGLGMMPPVSLRGRLGGIYHRPRFLDAQGLSPNQRLKAVGFRRMLHGGWFSHLLLLDPYLQARVQAREPHAPVFFLPDFFPADFTADRGAARQRFDLPADRRVFLFYGAGYARKGLALIVRAMLSMKDNVPAFLLCAGRHAAGREVALGLAQLTEQRRACVIDRYVSNEEEKLLFAASDVVLLAYIKHFGISGVLMRAIGAGRPVIVSDEQLLGRLVRQHGLGILFRPGDVDALGGAIARAALASEQEMAQWQAAVRTAAPNWTRAAFRDALIAAFAGAARPPATVTGKT
jgi:glycosyltransferase involved in cell wall biosynthesis